MLLVVSDFPAGWAEKASDNAESKLVKKCDSGTPEDRTGRAETGDFSEGSAASISESISVFPTSQGLVAELERFQSIADCVVSRVNKGEADDAEYAYSDASLSPLSFGKFGDDTKAYRLQIHVKVKGQTGLGSEGDAFVDVVNVLIGRIGFSIQGTDAFSPIDATELEQYVTKAASKVRQRLQQ